MADNAMTITVDGRKVRTLRDILPTRPGLRVLFVAKTPAPVSVEAGHYFQGLQGRMFWNRLKEYGLLQPTTPYEDDSLLQHQYGLTDIVKVPREYGNEPSDAEYKVGLNRILELVRIHRPKVVVFVYKRVLDQILRFGFDIRTKASYGFNPSLENRFDARVFAFPLPGTPCTAAQAASAMRELVVACGGPAAI
jgi:G:T/U-mismatch repair DNA glycosylase